MSVIKPVEFRGSSLDDLREFPLMARREAGYQLDRVQQVLRRMIGSPCAALAWVCARFVFKRKTALFVCSTWPN
jgi:hypothetical protein